MRIIFWRIFYFIINPFRFVYWKIFQPQGRGVKVAVIHEGKILFVKLAYAHKKWTIPGGNVDGEESYENAARREIKEETNLDLVNLRKIGEYLARPYGRRDTVWCYLAETTNPENLKIDKLEIAEVGWFDLNNLPEPRPPRVEDILTMIKDVGL